jgi:FAD/FMN-containing dehydrogenase
MEEALENKGSVKAADFCLEVGTLIAPNGTGACSPSYGNYGNMPDLQCSGG